MTFQRHRSLECWSADVLGNQRVAKFKAMEAAEVPIRGPQFADAMELAQRCHARIVYLRTGDSPIAHQGHEHGPVTFRLRQQRQARRRQPRVDLIQRDSKWTLPVVN